jgi:hypothetical protein
VGKAYCRIVEMYDNLEKVLNAVFQLSNMERLEGGNIHPDDEKDLWVQLQHMK